MMSTKTDYETRAKKFIQQIYPYLQNRKGHLAREIAVLDFNCDYHRNVKYRHGIARYALITSDYVVKVTFNQKEAKIFGSGDEEIALYARAQEDGMDYLFAKITRYTYQNMNFDIMPRIYNIEKTKYDAWHFMTEQELRWCRSHNLYDLHNANYGWKDGHIVIIDYAAYD